MARASRSRTLRMTLIIVGALTMLALAAPQAFAASAVPTPVKDVFDNFSVTVTDLDPGKTPTVVITGVVKKDVKRPVAIAIPMPAGSEVMWAGEIYGGDPSKDQMRPIAVEEKNGVKYAIFTLEHSPAGQVEVSLPSTWLSTDGTAKWINMQWAPIDDVSRVRLAVDLPSGYHGKTSDAKAVEVKGERGESMWWREYKPVAGGGKVTLSVGVIKGAAPAQPTSGTADATGAAQATATAAAGTKPVTPAPKQPLRVATTTVVMLIALVLLLGVGGALVMVTRKQSQG